MKTQAQPEVNIGLVGHVDHGKTTLTQALSGVWTDRHSEEIKKGISIRLGYADTNIYRCPKCEEPKCYSTTPKCKACDSETEFQRAISFVDAPGHETLMATMISGAAIMDGALLLIAANEPCPQQQTIEHLMALEIAEVKNVVILQNKIDLLSKEKIIENYKQISEFIKDTWIEDAPIIPISAHHDVNLDVLVQAIEMNIPTPDRQLDVPLKMNIARSFDINKPGTGISKLKGGVIGGSITEGRLGKSEEIEIAPGIKSNDNPPKWTSLTTKADSLVAGENDYEEIQPGGLVGIATKLDPYMTKSDSLIGNVLGKPGTLPPVRNNLKMEAHLLDQLGLTTGKGDTTITEEVEPIRSNTPLMLNIGTATTVGVVTSVHDEIVEAVLKLPICAEEGARVAMSRRSGSRWRLIGYGIIQ